jgi:hypothetical protein
MNALLRSLCRIARNQQGIAYLEFAISLPLLIAMLLGGVEVTRYILIAQKVEKVSVTVSDIVAQADTITTSELDNLILAAGQVMQPYSFDGNAYVIVSSVYKNDGDSPVVNWQYSGGGSWIKSSLVGGVGAIANLPTGFTMNDRENVIIAEVFYNYQPLFGSNILTVSQLYKYAIFKPRLGDLSTLGS